MSKPSNTPVTRARKFASALAKAILDFPVDEIPPMAEAVGWKWRGEAVTRDMVLDCMNSLVDWATTGIDYNKRISLSSDYTAGFSVHATEYGDGFIDVAIRWGLSSEGDSGVERQS